MTYSKRGPRARARRLLPFALILAPFVITAGGRLVYSSGSTGSAAPGPHAP